MNRFTLGSLYPAPSLGAMFKALVNRVLIVLALLAAAQTAWSGAKQTNVIYFIGDGMGMELLTAYRHYADDSTTAELELTWFDQHLVGMASTHPIATEEVTDSAASATALASGIKTYNGAIGVDINKQAVESVLEYAKKRGYQTAMVATSQINHATPASFAAHVDSRQEYDAIADQYLDRRYNGKPWVDILIGGGRKYFERDDRNLVHEFQALGYQYADNFNELQGLGSAPALALLADKGLPFALDEPPADRLRVMTAKALELLSPDRPFFLLVEASQIDWCAHANDIACTMAEMRDAEAALRLLSDYVQRHPNTLLLATADHSTGGFSMGAHKSYEWQAKALLPITASSQKVAAALAELVEASTDMQALDWLAVWSELTGIELSAEAKADMQLSLQAIAEAQTTAARNQAEADLAKAVRREFDAVSVTGWTTTGHTGGDVAVMAQGASAQVFTGHQDNTDLAKKLFNIIQ